VANNLIELTVPRRAEWGGSNSVNGVKGPCLIQDDILRLKIEMQTGDTIVVDAGSFEMPEIN
jgi:hypothetical protein